MENKVLLIDDDLLTLKVLKKYLADDGFDVTTATDGVDALKKLNRIVPDIILSDILMPVMDGFELLRILQKTPGFGGIPFVFLSAKTEKDDQLEGFRQGANEYICKPVDGEEFVSKVRDVLNKASVKARNTAMKAAFIAKISETPLDDLAQLIGFGQKSGKLDFRNSAGRNIGYLCFNEGRVIFAKTRTLEGEEAFYDLIDLKEGSVAFYGGKANLVGNISKDIKALLMNAALMRDESEHLERLLPGLNVVLRLHSSRVKKDLLKQCGKFNMLRIMTMITEGLTVENILKSGYMSSIRAGSIVSNLIQEKIASPVDDRFADEAVEEKIMPMETWINAIENAEI